MNPFEFMTALLAPHLCLICKKESRLLCHDCAKKCLVLPKSSCYRCQKKTIDYATCAACLNHSPITHLWASSLYAGAAKELIALLKFQRAKAAATVISDCLDNFLPHLPRDTIVVPVPTANRRVRVRGYDQAELITRHLARRRGLEYRSLLRRVRTTRQVGSSRQQRFSQLEGAFVVQKPRIVTGASVLLIDDVLTTGATLESAATVLSQAGAKQIGAAVFSYQPLKQRAPVIPKLVSNHANYSQVPN
jgi:ComF family protein